MDEVFELPLIWSDVLVDKALSIKNGEAGLGTTLACVGGLILAKLALGRQGTPIFVVLAIMLVFGLYRKDQKFQRELEGTLDKGENIQQQLKQLQRKHTLKPSVQEREAASKSKDEEDKDAVEFWHEEGRGTPAEMAKKVTKMRERSGRLYQGRSKGRAKAMAAQNELWRTNEGELSDVD